MMSMKTTGNTTVTIKTSPRIISLASKGIMMEI
jgi:hypothetical protein